MANEHAEQEFQRRYGQVVAKAWTDPAFKARLLADPTAVLRDHGIEVPPEVEVRVVEDTDRVVHLQLPRRPAEGELSDDQLDEVAGGIILVGGALNFGWRNFYLGGPDTFARYQRP